MPPTERPQKISEMFAISPETTNDVVIEAPRLIAFGVRCSKRALIQSFPFDLSNRVIISTAINFASARVYSIYIYNSSGGVASFACVVFNC